MIEPISKCRLCESQDLVDLFSIGDQYVNDFVPEEKIHDGIRCPIELVLCTTCTLVQLRHSAPQSILYSRQYWYRSGVTHTMREALANVVEKACRRVALRSGDIVLDIGSNDGTLLRSYERDDLVRVGVEPAENLREVGSVGLDVFIGDFWSADKYLDTMKLAGPSNGNVKAKIITACGMFYDLEDPSKFIGDVARCLHPEGIFVAQLMCLRNMLNIDDIGNMAHEHLEFYSLESLDYLFSKHGLEVFDVEVNKVNGESYRFYVQHKRPNKFYSRSTQFDWWISEEKEMGLHKPEFYQDFFQRMEDNKEHVVDFIKDAKAHGKSVWVYGASTKGNVILQYYGLGSSLIDGAADRSPEKWGKYTIGTGIKIYSEEDARAAKPDYFLVLPYAFLPEFIVRERVWLQCGGQFLVPLPKFQIVGRDEV